MTFTQENRLLRIVTERWADVLLLKGFGGNEGISRPFSFELDLISENQNIPFEDIIGQNLTISITLQNGEQRFFNGIISKFCLGHNLGEEDTGERLVNYSATLIPWFWLLSRTSDSRIFQQLSVPDIVRRIFDEKDFNDYRMSLQGTYEPKEYCVQYRETDSKFISRLLEQEGIYYFFVHEDGRHTMVLADSPNEHRPCPNQETARYHVAQGATVMEEDVISQIEKMQEIRIGKYTVNDYNFLTPTADLKVEANARQGLGPGEREVYDYPAEYPSRTEGDRLANIRMQMEEARVTTLSGTSNCRAFISGYRFRLTHHQREDMNEQEFVLASVSHAAFEPGVSSGEEGAGATYTNSFACIPHSAPYRPPLVTPKPLIGGVQTAIVTGPEGEEIYTDEHGRVKVQFHWDREGESNEDSSCWIRVSQLWAGAGWGAMFIPRIGHEVIVDFIEGDPDRPIITGRVYHGNNMPPYGLPDEMTKSTIMSESSPGGGGSNEIRFEDKAGEEEVYIHAQKDRNDVVENDQSTTVHNNRTTTVDVDDTEEIGNNQTLTVGGTQSLDVTSDRKVTVGANHTERITGNQSVTVTGSVTIDCPQSATITFGSGMTINTGGTVTINASAITITAGMISLNSGMVQVSGVVQCATLIASSVVSPTYTPGAGNIL